MEIGFWKLEIGKFHYHCPVSMNQFPSRGRHWGQHFLADDQVLRRVVAAARVRPGETILEIGPGHGALTRALLTCGALVVAIEKDPRFALPLTKECSRSGSFRLVVGDAVRISWRSLGLADRAYAIVANLPYSITTPLLEKLGVSPRPNRAILMIQKDVADRIVSQ